MKKSTFYLFVLLTFFAGCQQENKVNIQSIPNNKQIKPHELYQVSTIDALSNGVFDGDVTVKEIASHGDIGIGTFNKLDGEMIVLDNKVYQAKSDGQVCLVADTVKSPFATLTFFKNNLSLNIESAANLEELKSKIDRILPSKNIIYAFKITGNFNYVKVRSVPAQKKPYVSFDEAVKRQTVFEYKNIKGTLVGFKLPVYFTDFNIPGYHLHFISDDKKKGGHLLDVVPKDITVEIETIYNIKLNLINSDDFLFQENTNHLKKIQKQLKR